MLGLGGFGHDRRVAPFTTVALRVDDLARFTASDKAGKVVKAV